MQQRTIDILRYALLVLLAVWGGYTLLAYLGVPVHMSVLISPEDKADIAKSCTDSQLFCAGWRALVPTIGFTLRRLAPVAAYIVISLLVIAGLYVKRYLQDNEWGVKLSLAPWKVLLVFLASLWLLFTTLSFGVGGDDLPFRRIFEPVPQVYVGAGPEALEALKANFNRLQTAGCLEYVGETNHKAGVFNVKLGCMQGSFVTRVLPLVVLILSLLFIFASFGRLLLTLGNMRPRHPLLEIAFSIGLGAGGMILLLWLLAIIGIYTANAGWVLLIAMLGISWRHAWYWIRRFLWGEWTVQTTWHSATVWLGWLLISYLAFNFLSVVRPFPIGWDDLGRYINQPRLMVSYGHIVPALATYQWEYITSLGFLLFGYDSVFGPTAAMMINWMAGLLAVMVMYAAGAAFLGRGRGLLTALLYYTLPMVGHFSFADMKVDNAVFVMGSLGVLALLLALFPMAEEEETDPPHDWPAGRSLGEGWRWLVLAGIFGGLAFSLKPTAIMMITSSVTLLLAVVHWTGFVGGFFLTWALYGAEGRMNLGDILARLGLEPTLIGKGTFVGICAVIGLGAIWYASTLKRSGIMRGLKSGLIVAGALFLTISPWLIYNNIQHGNVIPRLELGFPNRITPTILLSGGTVDDPELVVRSLPPELAINPSHPACTSTSKSEELDRYWGYGTGVGHYLTLPWRVVMNIDSAGYYITLIPALLCVPLLFLLPYAWTRRGRWALWLTFATFFAIIQWVLFANGIPWYGLSVFFGLCLALEVLVAKAPDKPTKYTASVLIAFSLLIAFAMRFWQYEQQSNLLEYPIGKVSAEAMQERTIPHYDDIREVAMQRFETMKDRPYVYRIGTFIPYFIPRNLEVLPLADHQMDTFNCLFQERDPQLTLRRMMAIGFNSIIFDTNTHTIERDPNGSLHKKVERFVEFINAPGLDLRIMVNDPGNGIAYILLPDEPIGAAAGSGATVN